MDGVLINSEPLHERAKREALLEVGIMVPESLFASYTGRSDKAMIYEVAAGHGLNEQRSAEILDRKHRIYESLEHMLCPVSGAIEFVHWAKSRYRRRGGSGRASAMSRPRRRSQVRETLQMPPTVNISGVIAAFLSP